MLVSTSCQTTSPDSSAGSDTHFNYQLEQFADLRILRYQVPNFDQLNLRQKKLIYFLSQAALCGRDILWDQNGRYNLAIRQVLENIYTTYTGDMSSDSYKAFLTYLKQVWYWNGIYHHYSNDKILPGFSVGYFNELVYKSNPEGFPAFKGSTPEETLNTLIPVLFDPQYLNKKVNQKEGSDMVAESAVNFYRQVSQHEATEFYHQMKNPSDSSPPSYGLNSRLSAKSGVLEEQVWKSGGLYGPAIDQIVYWLQQAQTVAETSEQQAGIALLIRYYETGDLKTWDEYNIQWVADTAQVDFVNGFIETYSDPLGMKGSWESVVNFTDLKATRRTQIISQNAPWFEAHSPIDDRFKKQQVVGISAKVITVAMLGGDCYPYSPLGINLPNSDWIRKDYGSKSVSLENIAQAHAQANLQSGFLEEFSYDTNEYKLVKTFGPLTDNLHTDLHECLGHGSGQLIEGVSSEALKNYHAPLEEARADLFALYYLMDPKMIELGLLPNPDAAKAQYLSYIRNGLMTQLRRIEPGKNIEQAHMRNRQLIARWCYEKGQSENIIEKMQKEGKTYFRINDYEKLRQLFAILLAEIQRIKSEGDYTAGKTLVETYGVKVDPVLHTEVLKRFESIHMAAYSGFVNPEYQPIEKNGEIIDIQLHYAKDYASQMLQYSRKYSFLPIENN